MDRDRIRALAEKASAGPWKAHHDDGVVSATEKTGPHTARYVTVCRNASIDDAHFIEACSPDVILTLLAERDALVEALEWLSDESRYDQTVTCYARATLSRQHGETDNG